MFIDFKTGIKNPNQFAYFNALKFIGAFCIAFFLHFQDHFLLYLSIKNPFTNIFFTLSVYSYCFVEMFFIISGILFSYVYQPKITQGLSFKAFIKKRSLRLLPLAVLTTLTAYSFNLLLFQSNFQAWNHDTIKNILYDTFFLTKIINADSYLNGPVWYITVLMVCYILGFLFTKYKASILFILTIIIGIYIQNFRLDYPFLNSDFARGFLSFFVGVMMKSLLEKFSSLKKDEKTVLRIFLALVIIFCLFFYQKNSFCFYPTVFSAFFIFVPLVILLSDLKCLNKLCNTKFVKWLGDISFDIYLWNFPIYMLLHLLIIKGCFQPLNIWFLWILAITIHFAVATLSHKINLLIRQK